jgi:SulP family sulfate permease
MKYNALRPHRPPESFAEVFCPSLFSVLRGGYDLPRFAKDVIAGLTVAIVALPLAMGIAIGSGTTPERGLFTAIIAGFLISFLGGSRFQIGGPTAAFIVVVYRTIDHHGYDGLALATMMAGIFLLLIGFLRLGLYIKYIPYPVTLGFTAGIGLTIFVSQIADLLGLQTGKLPGEFVPKVWALINAVPTAHWAAALLSLGCLLLILFLQKLKPHWPRFLIAVVGASLAVMWFNLDITTIGSKFGGIPSLPPMPSLPPFSAEKLYQVLPDALAIALLAGIESLLSAVVADGMAGTRHRSNMELVAQGVANVLSPIFGGLPATGAIARTATNIRAGAYSPVSGMLHAAFLLLFMIAAAPLASYVPLPVLAVILALVAWNMSEIHVIGHFLGHATKGDRFVLLITMFLTVYYDLIIAIGAGIVFASFKFMHNMANMVEIETSHGQMTRGDGGMEAKTAAVAQDPETLVFRIHGPFFFGAASELARVMDAVDSPKKLVLDFADVPLLDSTGASALKGIVAKAHSAGTRTIFAGARRAVKRSLILYGLHPPEMNIEHVANIEDA